MTQSQPKQAIKKVPTPVAVKPGEQEWKGIEIFRTEFVSSRSGRRRRNVLFASASVILAAVLIYVYFFT